MKVLLPDLQPLNKALALSQALRLPILQARSKSLKARRGLCLVEEFLDLLGTLSGNGDIPFLGFFLELIPYFIWEFADFLILLK